MLGNGPVAVNARNGKGSMETIGAFIAGIAAGWVMRSTVDSSRDLTVRAIAAAYDLADRARRFTAVEREHLEDLVAEGRAVYEASRARRAVRATETPRPTAVGRQDRAA